LLQFKRIELVTLLDGAVKMYQRLKLNQLWAIYAITGKQSVMELKFRELKAKLEWSPFWVI
jgi:hypothetical protein